MNRDFVEILCALSEAEAEFMIVGAHALAASRRDGHELGAFLGRGTAARRAVTYPDGSR